MVKYAHSLNHAYGELPCSSQCNASQKPQNESLVTAPDPGSAEEDSYLEGLVKLSLQQVIILMTVQELHQAHGSAVVS